MSFEKELEIASDILKKKRKTDVFEFDVPETQEEAKKKKVLPRRAFKLAPLLGRDKQGVSAGEIGSVDGVTTTAHTAASGVMA